MSNQIKTSRKALRKLTKDEIIDRILQMEGSLNSTYNFLRENKIETEQIIEATEWHFSKLFSK